MQRHIKKWLKLNWTIGIKPIIIAVDVVCAGLLRFHAHTVPSNRELRTILSYALCMM